MGLEGKSYENEKPMDPIEDITRKELDKLKEEMKPKTNYGERILTKEEFSKKYPNHDKYTPESSSGTIPGVGKGGGGYNPGELGFFGNTENLQERGLIEAGIYNISGEQLRTALKNLNITDVKELKKDQSIFNNTSRDEGYTFDKMISYLGIKRLDKKVMHTKINRPISFITKSGENITREITYDIFMREGNNNIYTIPNTESIQKAITLIKQNKDISILETPSIPIAVFNILSKGGINAFNSGTTPGTGGGGGGNPGVGGVF